MKRLVPVLALAALSVAACNKTSDNSPPAASGPSAASDASQADAPNNTASAPTPATPQAPMLAMAYSLGLTVPANQVQPLMESHQEACERAGPDQCQVLAANDSAESGDRASAALTLRATPAWMRMFRTRAEADAKDLGGKVQEATTDGEDLSKSIVDTEAAQRARAAERARLTELMRRKTKNLDQTMAVEHEITQVQTDMDQGTSEVAAMKDRIAMETMTVSYESAAMVAPEGSAAPLAVAAQGFMGHVYAGLAVLIVIASYLLPFALVGAPLAWWLRRRRSQAARGPAARAETPAS
jgi:hypothetical protein